MPDLPDGLAVYGRYCRGDDGMNKRKRVALAKHRTRKRKLKARARTAR